MSETPTPPAFEMPKHLSKRDRESIERMQETLDKANEELEANKAYREEQQQKATDIAKAEYDIKKTEALDKLKKLSPEKAEEHKDSHLNRIEDVLDGAGININKLSKLGANQQNNDDNPPDEVHYGYDPLKGNLNKD